MSLVVTESKEYTGYSNPVSSINQKDNVMYVYATESKEKNYNKEL